MLNMTLHGSPRRLQWHVPWLDDELEATWWSAPQFHQVIPWCLASRCDSFLAFFIFFLHTIDTAPYFSQLWTTRVWYQYLVTIKSTFLHGSSAIQVHPAQVPGIIPMADVEMLVWDGWLVGILVIIRLAGSQEFTAIHPKVVSLSQQVALNVKWLLCSVESGLKSPWEKLHFLQLPVTFLAFLLFSILHILPEFQPLARSTWALHHLRPLHEAAASSGSAKDEPQRSFESKEVLP